MDIINVMRKINEIGKYFVITVFVLNLMSVVSATDAAANIRSALSSLCVLSQTFLGFAAMIMIILAGSIYALGQVLGAETRARASVWATAMLTGAVIGILIYIITPYLVGALLGAQPTEGDPCRFEIGTTTS